MGWFGWGETIEKPNTTVTSRVKCYNCRDAFFECLGLNLDVFTAQCPFHLSRRRFASMYRVEIKRTSFYHLPKCTHGPRLYIEQQRNFSFWQKMNDCRSKRRRSWKMQSFRKTIPRSLPSCMGYIFRYPTQKIEGKKQALDLSECEPFTSALFHIHARCQDEWIPQAMLQITHA